MLRRFLKDNRGAGTVEFVLMLPLLLALTMAGMVFSLAAHADIAVVNASREGARVLAVTQDPAEARQRAASEVAANLRTSWGSDTLFSPGSDVQIQMSGGYGTVTVTYRQPTLIPGIGGFLGGSPWSRFLNLKATTTMQLET